MELKPGSRVIMNLGMYGEEDADVTIVRRVYDERGAGWLVEDVTGERAAFTDWEMQRKCEECGE